ncbi:putative cytochrome c biogenesis ccmB-like mitochondrial protein [Capsicum chinense]|nr:putative cytochrome c biogenesis ccmB-like mitochondrial protein [Capsicum chinense]
MLQLPYQFYQSGMDRLNIPLGSMVLNLLCGIHSHSTLGITTSSGWNKSQNPTTSPTSLPSTVTRTSIETEWFYALSSMGYFSPFTHIYRNRKRITLILNQIEPDIILEMGRSGIGVQPPGENDVHRPVSTALELALLAIEVLGGIPFAILGKLSVEDIDAITDACVLESTPGGDWVFSGL